MINLSNKTQEEKINIKADAIVALNFVGKYTKDGVVIEVQSLKKINGGVEILARAWKNGKQLGFGDGTVDIERFRIFNPPILVDDPNGNIVREWTGKVSGERYVRKLREDPIQAIKNSLAHIIYVSGKPNGEVILGKVGSTTSTFFPAAGAVEPVDGVAWRGVASPGEIFSTIRNGAGVSADSTGTGDDPWFVFLRATTTTDQYDNLARSIFGFDTSSIPDGDTIDSATFSIFGFSTIDNAMSLSIVIDRRVPTSTSSIASGDYNIAGWDAAEQSSTRIALGSWSTTGYNDFTLSATGLGNINKTGLSWFGCRIDKDFDNSAPTWVSGAFDKVRGYFADQTGTDNDPKLVVVHTASTSIKTFNGLANASVKTVNGLARASVKTWNGLE